MKIKCHFLLFVVTFLIFHATLFGQLSSRESRIVKDLSEILRDDVKKDNLHGSISAALIKNGRVIWADAFGNSSINKEVVADTNTIYRIGSITKTFTAVILMQLVQEGKVRLDDPVEIYVPEVKSLQGYPIKKKITLRQLASHTSGLNREPSLPDADVGPTEQWESKVLLCIPATSFNCPPGEKFLYSNIGFALLGLALERASGVPFIEMVQQRIFSPLHMDDSFFSLSGNKKSRLAEGIDNEREENIDTVLPLQETGGRGYRVPNGGIYSTPADLAKFVISLMSGGTPLLTSGSFHEMKQSPQWNGNYGLGLMISHERGINMIGHNGSVPGYTAQFEFLERGGYGIILMRNYNKGVTNLGEISRNVLEQF
jgi:CubicO group peptidase (beta-lactamase class C family)